MSETNHTPEHGEPVLTTPPKTSLYLSKRWIFITVCILVGAAAASQIMRVIQPKCSKPSLATTWVDHEFRDCTVYVRADPGSVSPEDDSQAWLRIPFVDLETFTPLTHGYAVDEQVVYYKQQVIPNADPATFTLLTDSYATDARAVYWRNREMVGADPNKFSILDHDSRFGIQNDSYFFEGVRIAQTTVEQRFRISEPKNARAYVPAETVNIQWSNPTGFSKVLVALVDPELNTRFITPEPIENTGSIAVPAASLDIMEGVVYSVHVIALPDTGSSARVTIEPKALVVESAYARIYVHETRSSEPIFVRQGADAPFRFAVTGVRSCTLQDSDGIRPLPDYEATLPVPIKIYDDNVIATTAYILECQTLNGRTISDTIRVVAYPPTAPDPVHLTVTQPNGGERFVSGGEITVTWTGARLGTLVDIILTNPNDTSGSTISTLRYLAEGIPNTGTYTGAIGDDISPGDTYLVRVICHSPQKSTELRDTTLPYYCVGDDSDAPVTIGTE